MTTWTFFRSLARSLKLGPPPWPASTYNHCSRSHLSPSLCLSFSPRTSKSLTDDSRAPNSAFSAESWPANIRACAHSDATLLSSVSAFRRRRTWRATNKIGRAGKEIDAGRQARTHLQGSKDVRPAKLWGRLRAPAQSPALFFFFFVLNFFLHFNPKSEPQIRPMSALFSGLGPPPSARHLSRAARKGNWRVWPHTRTRTHTHTHTGQARESRRY